MSELHHKEISLDILKAKLPTYEEAMEISDVLSVLSDPTRIRILWLLCHTTDSVSNVADAIGMSAPAVSHHLKLLKQHGILKSEKKGKETMYHLADTRFAYLIHGLLDDMLDITCPNKSI